MENIVNNTPLILILLLIVLLINVITTIVIYYLLSNEIKNITRTSANNNQNNSKDISKSNFDEKLLLENFQKVLNKNFNEIEEKINNKFLSIQEKLSNSVSELSNLIKDNINTSRNLDETNEDYENIFVLLRNDNLVRTSTERYLIIKKEKKRIFLTISENLLECKPTPEYDSIIEKFYNLERKQNSSKYKLKTPTELEYFDEKTGEYKIKNKGLIVYD